MFTLMQYQTSSVNPFGLILILKEMVIIFFIIDKYCYNGVFFINDIISEDK
jgi:hypothetical protein